MEYTNHTAGEAHITSVRTNLIVFAVLMALLVLTVAVAYLDLGALGLLIAMLIASVKAVLIVLFFMHVRHGSRVQMLFAFAAFAWLAIMLVHTLSDYVTRAVHSPLVG
jgi:cytochrome c oxidase subunit 4